MFRQHVGLKVDGLADPNGVQVGVLPSVRSDPEDGLVFVKFRNGERNAVNGDRAFVDTELVDFRRQ